MALARESRRARTKSDRRLRAVAVVVTALLAGWPGLGRAVDITVTETADDVTDDGDCSLREAIFAANQNIARDACPAGSSAATDRVVLADGATYTLTIDGSETQSLAGALDLRNNPQVVTDLVLEVVSGGAATIVRDGLVDDGVVFVNPNATVEIRGVTITGGGTAAGASGGALVVSTGANVLLEDCTVVRNFADNNGGAISVNGILTMARCVVADNVALKSGGAMLIGSTGAASITDSVFAGNVALESSGGAIRTNGQLDVSRSSFVDNRSSNLGGAIANSATIPGKTTIDASCFVGNSDVAVDSFSDSAQTATNSWWGASDGPSGAGFGGGDSVGDDFDTTGFLPTPPAACRPQELVADGGFQLAEDGLPVRWRTRRLQVANGDGTACGGAQCQLRITGDGQVNQALQTLDVPGVAGDSVTIRALSSAVSVPTTPGKYLAELLLVHADGSRQRKTLKFSPGSHGLEERSKTIVATEAYVKLKVRIEYGRASGTVQFDDVSVVLE